MSKREIDNRFTDFLASVEEQKPVSKQKPVRSGTAGSSEQRGLRADPAYRQINASIPKDMHASLFYYLKREGGTLSGLILELLGTWLEEQGGTIFPEPQESEKVEQ